MWEPHKGYPFVSSEIKRILSKNFLSMMNPNSNGSITSIMALLSIVVTILDITLYDSLQLAIGIYYARELALGT